MRERGDEERSPMGQHRLVRAWGASLALALAVGGFGAVPAAFADDASAGGGVGFK